jgi:glutathione synthase
LKQGATPQQSILRQQDHDIVAKISPQLLKNGIVLAGIDVIGDKIIEVNALNPGGIYHASRLSGVDLAKHIMHSLQIRTTAAK